MSSIFSVQGVSKYFGDFAALKDVSVEIPKGEIFGLLGPNGAGKTTLIRILTQITGPDSGQILFNGGPISFEQETNIGYLPEERDLYRKMKVWKQAIYLTQLKGLSKNDAIANLKPWFERLKMTDWVNKPVESLSKGMQQRLQFVITVAHKPDLLILDEPFSGFDPVNAEELKREILGLKERGTSIILSTHNMNSVEELCDSIALVNKGEIVLNGRLDEIKKQFSKSMFSVRFKGSQMAFANTLGYQFEVVEISDKNGVLDAKIIAHDNVKSNDLLRALIASVEVISFNELLPTMNDIFIDLVSTEKPETEAA